MYLLNEAFVRRVDLGQGKCGLSLLGARARGDHGLQDRVRADFVKLVHDSQHRLDVGDPDAEVEPLRDLAVVDLDPKRTDRQLAERVGDHQRQLGLVLGGQLAYVDNVDVALGELAIATFLRALTAPYLLNLVAAEWEG